MRRFWPFKTTISKYKSKIRSKIKLFKKISKTKISIKINNRNFIFVAAAENPKEKKKLHNNLQKNYLIILKVELEKIKDCKKLKSETKN